MSKSSTQFMREKGAFSPVGLGLFILLIFAVVGFSVWALSNRQKPALVYTPPPVTANTPLSAGKSTKEIIQDYKVLEATLKRNEGFKTSTETALNDKQFAGSVRTTSIDIEQQSISSQQNDYIKECNRRIQALTKAQPSLDRLTSSQRPAIEQLINSEITVLNGLKVNIVEVSDADGIAEERQKLNSEYDTYLLAISQVNLLAWANDQSILNDKLNKVGGKIQERADTASSNGKSIAATQILLNGFQANKVNARESTSAVIKIVPTIRPEERNANLSAFKSYQTQLTTAHNELVKAVTAAKKLVVEVQKFDLET